MSITPDTLHHEGLDWLLDTSFLGHLEPEEQISFLAGASWTDFPRGGVLIEAGTAAGDVHVIVAGQALVVRPDGERTETLARVGPGHLLGERSHLRNERTGARVVAMSPLRTLHLSSQHFSRLMATSPAFKSYVSNLVDLREKSQLLLNLLLQDPVLRSLGRDDLEQLLQSGRLIKFEPGDRIVNAGSRCADAYLVVSGRVAVYAPAEAGDRRTLLTTKGSGWFFGHAAVLLDTPRTADVEAVEPSELLEIKDKAFMELISRNPPLQRRLYQHLAELDLHAEAVRAVADTSMTVAIWSGERGMGTGTLAYGVAAAFRIRGGKVTLIDLDGARNAARLRRLASPAEVAGIQIMRAHAPEKWGIDLVWPQDPADSAALIKAVAATSAPEDTTVLSLSDLGIPDQATIDAAETLVYYRWARDASTNVALDHNGFRVDVVRLDGDELPMATTRNAVRMPADRETADRFWRTGDIDLLVDKRSPSGRACSRLVRVLTGRTVGVALGGGGALGFSHIGLLRALDEADIPVDYIAGASFGSLVGGFYAAGGLPLIDELIQRRKTLKWLLNLAYGTLRPLTTWIDRMTGDKTLSTTEIPFFPVAVDVITGKEAIVTRGSVAEGIKASSSFPGLFPADRRGVARLVDGGIVNNVPASVVWDAGANFIIAANPIPSHPVGRDPDHSRGLKARIRDLTINRMDDILRSVFLLMSQTGRDRATLADYIFDLKVEGYTIHSFDQGPGIAEAGLEQAREAIDDILYLRESDRSLQIGQR